MGQLSTWVDAMQAAENKFKQQSIALGNPVKWEVEASFARQILQKNDYLAKMTPESIRDSIINIGAIGLTLNPAENLAYLVPRKGQCCLDISYMGLIRLATDTGSIKWCKAENVYSNDVFTYKGPLSAPDHNIDIFADGRGDYRGTYCVAKTSEDDILVELMTAVEVLAVRDTSEAYKSGKPCPWTQFFGEMAKKTVIKRASKTWPKSDNSGRLDAAIHVINEHEGLEKDITKDSWYIAHDEARDRNADAIQAVVEALAEQDYYRAVEAYHDITDDDHIALRIAPTKFDPELSKYDEAPFDTKERNLMKSNLWHEARKEYFNVTTAGASE